ncbi:MULTISPECIES: metal-sulfur cluster assembly factor [Amniculibacterium]|jgi:metal-sulfur cluster biosynthetic enzyme|uniref:metal-sulfur cluster assembly factor n=1 Tax=Amniculibacterium TaxID=2715289 RepID=UPI000F599953|nr:MULTISPECIES: metal-sulfur cluster assembly factor [Amniculibacterium]
MTVETNDQEKCELALKGLYFVDDPEIGLNVVDLGLIYQIEFIEEEEKTVYTIMTLTSQFCPMGDSIVSNVTESIQSAFTDWKIKVELTFEPAWDSSKISPEGQEFLGY